jgi:glycosyltransferase involved in cell wall biosynthesis
MVAPTLDDYRSSIEKHGVTGREFKAPKVSVITIALNAVDTLAATIDSVHAQLFQDFEYIVVDGGSDDGTVDLLKRRLRSQDYWISEPDLGISDAFNKGVALASGAYIQLINADDWMAPDQLQAAVAAIERSGADFVFGDLLFYENQKQTYCYRGDPNYCNVINSRMPALNHPTVLVRRSAFERIGLFDLTYRLAMDYDWFLRLHHAGGRGTYDPAIVAHMNHAGVSNLQFRRTVAEVERVAVAHGRFPALARLESLLRVGKISISHQVKHRSRPLYDKIRSLINRSYNIP